MSTSRSDVFAVALALALCGSLCGCSHKEELTPTVEFSGFDTEMLVSETHSQSATGGKAAGTAEEPSEESLFEQPVTGDARRATGAFREGVLGGSWICEVGAAGIYVKVDVVRIGEAASGDSSDIEITLRDKDGTTVGVMSGSMAGVAPGVAKSFSETFDHDGDIDCSDLTVSVRGSATEEDGLNTSGSVAGGSATP